MTMDFNNGLRTSTTCMDLHFMYISCTCMDLLIWTVDFTCGLRTSTCPGRGVPSRDSRDRSSRDNSGRWAPVRRALDLVGLPPLPPLDGLSSATLDSPCDIISHWPGRPLPLHPDEALRRGATAENVELFFHPYEGP